MTRRFECDYIYQLPNGDEFFRRRRYRLDPPEKGSNKIITYAWKPDPTHIIYKKREGADALIYNLPAVMEAKKTEATIWWTEGEKCADALIAYGEVATTHHGGAGHVNMQQAEWLRGHRGLVLLAYDLDADDERGGNPGALDVIVRFDLLREVGIPRNRIGVVHARAGKDVYDHLAAGYPPYRMVPLRALAELRLKANRTTSSSFRRLGYSAPSRLSEVSR